MLDEHFMKIQEIAGFKTTAERRTRIGRMNRVHKPAMMRSEDRRLEARFPAPIQNQKLMSHQHGLSNNRTETTGFAEPDDSDDRAQKESENVAHARMVSNGRSSRIQDPLRNSPTTGPIS